MTLRAYFEEMETLSFQTQFSVISGLEVLRLAFSYDSTIKNLIAELNGNHGLTQEIIARIRYLLPKATTTTESSYDESIAAYLFCLSRVDLAATLDASNLVLMTGGPWWSVQLALHIKDYVNQITDSITASYKASMHVFEATSEWEASDFDALESLLEKSKWTFDTEDYVSTLFNFSVSSSFERLTPESSLNQSQFSHTHISKFETALDVA